MTVRPDQCTLVPVLPGEITSQAGWSAVDAARRARAASSRGCTPPACASACSSIPRRLPIRWARGLGADRVELYTEPFARAFERGPAAAAASFRHVRARPRELAHALGLGVNAGHDLDLDNLMLFRTLPHLDEVSIGHALISHALFVGLRQAVAISRGAVDGASV